MKIDCIKKEKGVFVPKGHDKNDYEGLVVRSFVQDNSFFSTPYHYDFIIEVEGVTFYVNFRADKKNDIILYEEYSGGFVYKSTFGFLVRSSEKAFIKSLVEALENKCLNGGTSLPWVIEYYRLKVLKEMELWKISVIL